MKSRVAYLKYSHLVFTADVNGRNIKSVFCCNSGAEILSPHLNLCQ